MSVKPDILPDYTFKPEDLDPDRLIAYLPGWTFKGGNLGGGFSSWVFNAPHYNLQLCFENRRQIKDRRAIIQRQRVVERDEYFAGAHAIISIFRLEIDDLRLIVAQAKPDKYFRLNLYSPQRSYHLTKDLTNAPHLPEYDISVFEGRNREVTPFWQDLLIDLFRLQPGDQTNRSTRIGIGRLYGG